MDTIQANDGNNCGENARSKNGNKRNFLAQRSMYRYQRLHRQYENPYIRNNVDDGGCYISIRPSGV